MRAFLRVLGHAFVRGPGPALLVCSLFCVVAFGPNGLDPRDVVRMLPAWSLARLAFVTASALVLRAGVRALLLPAGATYLRASTIPRRGQLWLVSFVVFLATAPLPVVLTIGRAPGTAVVVWLATATACVAGRPWMFAVAIGASLLPPTTIPFAVVLYTLTIRSAYRDAPVMLRRARRRGLPRRLPWPLALLVAATTTVVRASPRVLFALAAPLLGLSLVRAADTDARAERVLSLAALVAALGATPLVSSIGRLLRSIQPLTRGGGRSHRLAILTAALVLSTPSVAFAAGGHALAGTHREPLLVGVALVVGLLLVEGWLVARRRDAPLALVLWVLPLVVGCTILARAGLAWLSVALAALGLALPLPEVRRAEHR
ncbi:MAG: hypothetical protein IPJ34_12155 [Myxococcales bacterium]|nr:hypothetical protein [Myxococcales bacterium]